MNSYTAVILGVNGGVGEAIARTLTDDGHRCIGLAKDSAKFDGLVEHHCLDLKNFAELSKITNSLFQKHSDIKLVINTAGYYEMTGENGYNEAVFENNFQIAQNILSIFTPKLNQTLNSRIITVSSIDAIHPNINSFSYSVAKSAVSTLVKLYKKKYKESFVNFDNIVPGAIHTKMRANKKEDKEKLIWPSDVAQLCLFLGKLKSNVCFDDFVIYPKHFSYSN